VEGMVEALDVATATVAGVAAGDGVGVVWDGVGAGASDGDGA